MNFYKFTKSFIFCLPAEFCHEASIQYIKYFSHPKRKNLDPILKQKLFNLNFDSPVGLAAGYDKNAEVFDKIHGYNFGFIECGTVTPKSQTGNPKPRLFRLAKDQAIINRLGFNNLGMENFYQNIVNGKKNINNDYPIGINIGKNKDQENFITDYITLVRKFYPIANYLTINISSPNTKGLRDLQSRENLEHLITNIQNLTKDLKLEYDNHPAILYKIAPDQTEESLKDICLIAEKYNIDGLIISNTTISRSASLKSKYKNEQGGLSGKPLKTLANKILAEIYQETKGRVTLIGAGGISSARDAYERIISGASLIQLYSSLIYNGFYVINEINDDLVKILKANGFNNINEAIGFKNN